MDEDTRIRAHMAALGDMLAEVRGGPLPRESRTYRIDVHVDDRGLVRAVDCPGLAFAAMENNDRVVPRYTLPPVDLLAIEKNIAGLTGALASALEGLVVFTAQHIAHRKAVEERLGSIDRRLGEMGVAHIDLLALLERQTSVNEKREAYDRAGFDKAIEELNALGKRLPLRDVRIHFG